MYMDNIKPKMKKELETLIPVERIESGFRYGIWHRKMCPTNNEKVKPTNDGRNRSTKSAKNQNVQRKGILQVLGNIVSVHLPTSRDRRRKKEYFSKTKKLLEIELNSRNLTKQIDTWAVLLVRYS